MLPPCVHFSNHKLIITLCSPLVTIFHIQICSQLLQTRPTGEKRYQLLQTAHTFDLRPPIPTVAPTQPTFNPSVCPVTTVERMDVEPNTKKKPTLKIPPSACICTSARTQTFTPPLHPSLKARVFIKPSVLTLTHPPIP